MKGLAADSSTRSGKARACSSFDMRATITLRERPGNGHRRSRTGLPYEETQRVVAVGGRLFDIIAGKTTRISGGPAMEPRRQKLGHVPPLG